MAQLGNGDYRYELIRDNTAALNGLATSEAPAV